MAIRVDSTETVTLDGVDITRHVRAVDIRRAVGEIPTITLEMYAAVKLDSKLIEIVTYK